MMYTGMNSDLVKRCGGTGLLGEKSDEKCGGHRSLRTDLIFCKSGSAVVDLFAGGRSFIY